ncbi:MAG: hypothetical protein HJJLKODD_02418 [Phycisphaerae bacterium]|nr:hypothetical protein [Phycisphaerae bacterium]
MSYLLSGNRIGLSISMFLGSLALAGCGPTVWVEEVRTLELSSAHIERLVASSHNGDIKVYAVEQADAPIQVEARIKAGGRSETDARSCLSALKLDSSISGGDQNLCPKFEPLHPAHWQLQVTLHVQMPKTLQLQAASHNGDVFVSGIAGNLHIESHNGNLTVRDGVGELQAASHNGRIEVTTRAAQVRLESHNGEIFAHLRNGGSVGGAISSHNGGIVLDLAAEISASLNCSTQNGSIEINRTAKIISRKSTQLQAQLGNGGAELKVESLNGSITVH